MRKFARLACAALLPVLLAACAVSGGNPDSLDVSRSAPGTTVQSVSLPPLPDESSATGPSGPKTDLSSAEAFDKFSQSDLQTLVVDSPTQDSARIQSDIQQAYADAAASQPVISTSRTSLRPFVGRWILDDAAKRSKLQRVGSFLGLTEGCVLVLEDASSEYGYKASGNSACPTSLFMLDSWVAFDNRLVLRDHMGDDIVKLTSRGGKMWVGVSKEGNTLILTKS